MRFLIGCSGVLSLVAFAIGFAVSLFIRDATWTDRLMMAGMPAVITFVAALLLSNRDSAEHSRTVQSVRNAVLAGDDTSDDDFVSSRPSKDATLLLETRQALSRFFDVPTGKIGRHIRLIHDLQVDKLQPSFQFYVVDSVIASQRVELQPFGFSMAGLETIDDLTDAIRHVLDDFDRNTDNQGKPEA